MRYHTLEPLSSPLFSPSSRRRLNQLSLRPLLITSERLIDGRQQLSRQVLMEKFLPMVREARPNKNATMQNKWLFKVSEPLLALYHFEGLIEKLADSEHDFRHVHDIVAMN